LSFNAAATAAEPSVVAEALNGLTSDMQLTEILKSLSDTKAEDIVQIDLRGKSTIGDHMVIASGRSSRQVNAIATNLADHLKQTLQCLARIEGKDSDDWILVDTGDVIVHIFRPEVREFYQLEKMWQTPLASAKNV
jgi:ribosome-associated protein